MKSLLDRIWRGIIRTSERRGVRVWINRKRGLFADLDRVSDTMLLSRPEMPRTLIFAGKSLSDGERKAVKLLPIRTENSTLDQEEIGLALKLECRRASYDLVKGIKHPGIVATCDFGWDLIRCRGVEYHMYYLIHEFVDGIHLSEYMPSEESQLLKGRNAWFAHDDPSFQWKARIARDLCAALQWLHERGIVYSNLHPDNIIVTANPRSAESTIKLMDLDACTYEGEILSMLHDAYRCHLLYASPEQRLFIRQLDQRSDIFSTCCVVANLFSTESTFKRLRMENFALDPDSLDRRLPQAVRSYVAQGLSLHREDRPQSLVPLVGELQELSVDRRDLELNYGLKPILQEGHLGDAYKRTS